MYECVHVIVTAVATNGLFERTLRRILELVMLMGLEQQQMNEQTHKRRQLWEQERRKQHRVSMYMLGEVCMSVCML